MGVFGRIVGGVVGGQLVAFFIDPPTENGVLVRRNHTGLERVHTFSLQDGRAPDALLYFRRQFWKLRSPFSANQHWFAN